MRRFRKLSAPSPQGPAFAPTHRDEFYDVITRRYNDARLEAAKIASSKGIKMTIEQFKPIHFGAAWVARGYVLPCGDTEKTLLENVTFFPYGILNLDTDFDYMKWYEGAKTQYVGDWFTLPISYFQEHQGAYKGNLDHYNFRGGETFTFTVHSITGGTSPGANVNAWILAFVVLPSTKKESLISTV